MKRFGCLLAALCLLASPALAQSFSYGAWLPYWQYDDSMAEMQSLTGTLHEAVAFECLFDKNDNLLMLPEAETLLTSLRETCRNTDVKLYLSVVNDVEVSAGHYENKSKPLLERLFADETAESRHLEALTGLIDRYQLTGLELDYENLKGDTALWTKYASWIARLWTLCARDGINLRIVLPWDAPKYATLPAGPEYSVMCYNLYGTHSGPGPKADVDFLHQTCALYQPLLPNVRMAFATGGFDWHGSKIDSLTQREAANQLENACVQPERDPASGALHTSYDAAGETHTVWYADGATLALWRDTCAAEGFTSFDLFCLGGNDLNDWQQAFFKTQPQEESQP